MWGALSHEMTGLPYTVAPGRLQRSHSRGRSPVGLVTYVTLLDSRLPQPGRPGPVFISPKNRVVQLYPQALGSHFVAFYDTQGCCGGIRTRFDTGLTD
jgi:hypothetical protein